jgi:hypothetical protein
MSLQSVHWFSEHTGKARETIVKYLKASGIPMTPGPKMATLYETKDAFPVLYGQAEGGEQGELMKARTENLEADTALKRIKEQQLLGESAPIVALEWALSSACAQIAAVLETIPAKLKRRLPQLSTADLDIIRKEIAKARNSAAAVHLDLGRRHGDASGTSDSEGHRAALSTTAAETVGMGG